MKAFVISILCAFSIGLYAADFTPATAPSMTMQSVNNSSYMSSGSTYSSSVSNVGSYSPSASAAGPRRVVSSFGDITVDQNTDNNFNNPQFSPLGDALIPLLLMGMAYAAYIFLRRKKARMMP